MNNNLRYAGIAALAMLVIVPVVYYLTMSDPQFAVAVMLEIAVIGFFTVVFVMIVGLVEDHYPTEAKDSAAVTAWSQRAGLESTDVEEASDDSTEE